MIYALRRTRNLLRVTPRKISLSNRQPRHSSINTGGSNLTLTSRSREISSKFSRLSLHIKRKTSLHGIPPLTEFRETVPALGEQLAALIETERQNNPHFQDAFTHFHQQCQASINPNLSIAAVEEMLIQHLLTERLFATVFKNRDFTRPQHHRQRN